MVTLRYPGLTGTELSGIIHRLNHYWTLITQRLVNPLTVVQSGIMMSGFFNLLYVGEIAERNNITKLKPDTIPIDTADASGVLDLRLITRGGHGRSGFLRHGDRLLLVSSNDRQQRRIFTSYR